MGHFCRDYRPSEAFSRAPTAPVRHSAYARGLIHFFVLGFARERNTNYEGRTSVGFGERNVDIL
jgi:hypothetical protein